MRFLAVALAVVIACKVSGDDYPINPSSGGGGGGVGGHRDSGISDSSDGGDTLDGRVCLLSDARNLLGCVSTGAGGLAVTLEAGSATTADDGSFTIARPSGTDLLWQVTGTTIVTSEMPFGGVAQIPAITLTAYNDLLLDNGAVLITGQGSLMSRVVHGGSAVAGATATATPQPIYGPLYDGSSATVWNMNFTGAEGTVWFPGAAVGTVTLSVTPGGGSATPVPNIPIVDSAITFVTVDLP